MADPRQAQEIEKLVEIDQSAPPFADNGVGNQMLRRGYAYLDDYVLSTDEGADHEPTEFERFLLEDFMNGLMADEAMFGPVRALLSRLEECEGALRTASRSQPSGRGSADAELTAGLNAEPSAVGDLRVVHDWIASLSTLDMDDVVADGGVTAAMVVQQEAAGMAGRLARLIEASRPTKSTAARYRCRRCGRDEIDARANGCERGPCPMEFAG